MSVFIATSIEDASGDDGDEEEEEEMNSIKVEILLEGMCDRVDRGHDGGVNLPSLGVVEE